MARLEKVGLVSLGEAGNLGDDLILIAAVQAISDSGGARTVKYLSHGQPLPWEKIRGVLDLDVDLEKSQRAKEYAFWREASRFRDCDAIVLGGGGLLQDVHHPVRPYQWMQYCDGDVPTLGVGLGLGPLGRRWDAVFRTWQPLDRVYVRDDDSARLAHSRFGWEVGRSSDFVDPIFADKVLGQVPALGNSPGRRLGISIRAWPGLNLRSIAMSVERLATDFGADSTAVFVLESRLGGGPDVEISRSLAQMISGQCDVYVYDGNNLFSFLSEFLSCNAGVSMKFHASVLWTLFGVPVLPISYAPKTAALFGVPFRGLEFLPMVRRAESIWFSGPRSHDIVVQWLRSLHSGRSLGETPLHGTKLGKVDRFVFDCESVRFAIKQRLSHHGFAR